MATFSNLQKYPDSSISSKMTEILRRQAPQKCFKFLRAGYLHYNLYKRLDKKKYEGIEKNNKRLRATSTTLEATDYL